MPKNAPPPMKRELSGAWIPVTAGKPDTGRPVLLTNGQRYEIGRWHDLLEGGFGFFWRTKAKTHLIAADGFTHWMELPEHP